MKMVSITLAVPQDMKKSMETFQDVNWSAVAREAIKKKLILLEKFREFTKDSTVTEEDALELGRKLKSAIAKRHGLKNKASG